MEVRAVRRPKYVHKRQGSGSNETAAIVESSRGISTPTRVRAEGPETITSTKPAQLTTSSTITPSESLQLSNEVTVPSLLSTSIAQGQSSNSLAPTVSQGLALQVAGSNSVPTPAVPTSTTNNESTKPVPEVPENAPNPSVSRSINLPTTKVAELVEASQRPSANRLAAESEIPAASAASIAVTQQDTSLSSILVNSAQATAATTSIPLPSFDPISSTSSPASSTSTKKKCSKVTPAATSSGPSGALALQTGPTSTDTLNASMTTAESLPSGPVDGASNSTLPATEQPSNTATIAGAVAGSIIAFILLALLGVWCIRRRYKGTTRTRSPFSRSSSQNQILPTSPSPMAESSRADPVTLFARHRSLSTIAEQSPRPVSPFDLAAPAPVVRHSRSHTTTSIPPAIPTRSTARPPFEFQFAPAPLRSIPAFVTSPPPLHQSIPEDSLAMDSSFMGTISTYFSNPPQDTKPSTNHTRNASSTTTSSYSKMSLYNSFISNNNNNAGTRATSGSTSSALSSNPSRHTNSSSTGHPSSLGSTIILPSAWRDSMWSTSATTPISHSKHNSASGSGSNLSVGGNTYSYFPPVRNPSHRASRSMGDFLDWRVDTGFGSRTSPSAGGDIPTTPPRSPLREQGGVGVAW